MIVCRKNFFLYYFAVKLLDRDDFAQRLPATKLALSQESIGRSRQNLTCPHPQDGRQEISNGNSSLLKPLVARHAR
jgi:hypothetical protein